MVKLLKKIHEFISNLAVGLILMITLCLVISLFIGIKPFITLSGSMEPFIHTGSVCFVDTNADYDDIEEGDVIAFELSTGSLVTHRVILITDAGIETKGDNNDISDGITTTKDNFYGKTLFSLPYIGYIFKWLQQPENTAIFLIVIITVILLGIVDTKVERKKVEPK